MLIFIALILSSIFETKMFLSAFGRHRIQYIYFQTNILPMSLSSERTLYQRNVHHIKFSNTSLKNLIAFLKIILRHKMQQLYIITQHFSFQHRSYSFISLLTPSSVMHLAQLNARMLWRARYLFNF